MKNILFLLAVPIIFLSNCSRTEFTETAEVVIETVNTAETYDIVEISEINVSNRQEARTEMSVNSTVAPWIVGVRLRENPGTQANIITTLGLWEKLTVVETRDEIETINGNNGKWVKVRRENSQTTGWVFSYFLERIVPSHFLPVWEYNNGEIQRADIFTQIFTFNWGIRRPINEIRRQRLVLFWDNRQIDIFDRAILSDNGRVMAFNWLDPATISRDASEGIISGNRYLFVYNFTTHNLTKIDAHYMRQSDMYSERWVNNSELWDWGESAGFFRDENLEHFILNPEGTRIFYFKNEEYAVEVDLTTNINTTHQIKFENYFLNGYLGHFVVLRGRVGLRHTRETILYDPRQGRKLTEFNFHSPSSPNDPNGSSHLPRFIQQDRYLVTLQIEGEYRGLILHDLLTGRQRRLNDIELVDVPNEYIGELRQWNWVSDPNRRSDWQFFGQFIAARIIDFDNIIFSSRIPHNIPQQVTSNTVFQRRATMNRY